MLATKSDAVREYAIAVGRDRPLSQWILSDYDTWEPNPFYIGPNTGHPEYEDPICSAWATFKEAAAHARNIAEHSGNITRIEHYKNRCWVVWY